MNAPLGCEICVLGGGPAGAAAAQKLAALGHDVLVLEKARFPRPHVGESLAPGIWRQLDLLGLAEAVRAAGLPEAPAALVRWDGPAAIRPEAGDTPGLLVDRGRFDQLLLAAAREAGARIQQPARARHPRRIPGGWCVPVLAEDREFEVTARYLVDATGRAARLGGKKRRAAPPTVALHASWPRAPGAWRETRVEAGAEEWFWGAPLPDGTFNAMVFLDTDRYRSRRQASTGREALYRELLGGSALLCDLLRGEPPPRVLASDATCRFDPEPIGEDFVKLGEAAFTLDPLSASGVQVALRTAWSGSIAVHTLLERPGNAQAARRFYTKSQEQTVRRQAGWAMACYAAARGDSVFWRRRAGSDLPPARPTPPETTEVWDPRRLVRLSETAVLVDTPCITGDLIETRQALHHPALERAVAYLGDIEVAPLLAAVPPGATLGQLAAAWSATIPPRQAFAVAHWLIRRGILLAA